MEKPLSRKVFAIRSSLNFSTDQHALLSFNDSLAVSFHRSNAWDSDAKQLTRRGFQKFEMVK
jgi:hypothetical protein